MNPKTRKKTIIIVGALFVMAVIFIGYWVYLLNKALTWKEYDHDTSSASYATSSLLPEPFVNNIETYYVKGFRDGTYWYQTGWYPSVEELIESMSLDEEQEEIFIDILQNAPEKSEFGNSDLYSVPANDDRDVLFYEMKFSEIFEDSYNGWWIGYYVVVDSDTSEVSLAAIYNDT
ncbi:MAG: hypothetical protein MJ094_06715 [Saccharofermentans sp.]|nr:hypothetical protein [Saccharofermentans sp.]